METGGFPHGLFLRRYRYLGGRVITRPYQVVTSKNECTALTAPKGEGFFPQMKENLLADFVAIVEKHLAFSYNGCYDRYQILGKEVVVRETPGGMERYLR